MLKEAVVVVLGDIVAVFLCSLLLLLLLDVSVR